jgi:hypothetical protein
MPSAEKLAAASVRVTDAGGSYHVELTAHGEPPVNLGPFDNPTLAKEKAEGVRRVLAAILASHGGGR